MVGSANVDLTTFVHRFPKPGETVFGKEIHLGFGGKGANQAVAARIANHELLNVFVQISEEPIGQLALFDNDLSSPRDLIEDSS